MGVVAQGVSLAAPAFANARLLECSHGCKALVSQPVPAGSRHAGAHRDEIGGYFLGHRRHSRTVQARARRRVFDDRPHHPEESLACAVTVRRITARKTSVIGT